MISFPFDSQVTYDEFGKPIYDRAINSDLYSQKFESYFTTGVFPNPSTNFQVVSGTGMTVVVSPGIANIKGKFAKEITNRTLVVQAANATYDRIDRVVLRLNLNTEVRAIDLYVIAGTPASTPTAPALTRTSSIYEICLANLFITKNNATITQQKITDTRLDSTVCGVCATTVTQLDTTTLFNQYQDWLQTTEADAESEIAALVSELNAIISGGAFDILQDQIGTLAKLNTVAKKNLVASANEIDAKANASTTAIGTLAKLNTVAKKNLVASANEIDAKANASTTAIGTLASLTTAAKTNLVASANELNTKKVDQTTAAITYYVAKTGSDSNDGASGTPFLTIQHAIDILPKYLNHNVSINVESGTYDESIYISNFAGSNPLYIKGSSNLIDSTNYKINNFLNESNIFVELVGFNAIKIDTVGSFRSDRGYLKCKFCNSITPTSLNYDSAFYCGGLGILISESCNIQNKKDAFFTENGGKLLVKNCTGSNNTNVFNSETGGSIVNLGGNTISGINLYNISLGGNIIPTDSFGNWTPTVTIDGVTKAVEWLICDYTNYGNHQIVTGKIHLASTYTISNLMTISELPFYYTGHCLCKIFNSASSINFYLEADGTTLKAINFDGSYFRGSTGTAPSIIFQLICTRP